MDLAQARALMERHCPEDRLRKHCLASGAVLRALGLRLGQDAEAWAVAGLLHDLDYGETVHDMARHGLKSAEMLAPLGVDPAIVAAIKAHNAENLGLERVTPLDFALTCGETITGLIMATALVYPDKKLSSVKPKSVTKRMKEKAFAASVNRDHIMLCEKIGLDLPGFAALALAALQEISDELGL
jgi:uncharacterized protein